MLIYTKILNATGGVAYERWTTLDAEAVIEAAEPRIESVKQNGKQWVEMSVTTLGRGLLRAVASGTRIRVNESIVDLMTAAWVLDSMFGDLDAQTFAKCKHGFTVLADGDVIYDRVPA